MEKYFRPERLSLDPNEAHAARKWSHWKSTFENFIEEIGAVEKDKLKLLANFTSYKIYEIVVGCSTYNQAINALESFYKKPTNEVYARHQLASKKQESGESIDQYLRELKELSNDCNFQAVTAEQNRDDSIRDSFIRGLSSPRIRQRLLENLSLSLNEAYNQAATLEAAENQANSYFTPYNTLNSLSQPTSFQPVNNQLPPDDVLQQEAIERKADLQVAALKSSSDKCVFCGYSKHPRNKCAAREAICNNCGKKGHFWKVCRSSKSHQKNLNSVLTMASLVAATPNCLSKATVKVLINDISADALVDTGSSDSFISQKAVQAQKIRCYPTRNKITMASTEHTSSTVGHCFVDLSLEGHRYLRTKLLVLPELCADVVIGHDIMRQHDKVELKFGGNRPPLSVCNLLCAKVTPPSLFSNLHPDWKPIAVRSRRYSSQDATYIKEEILRLLSEGIIEPSNSPWRAQIVVVNKERKKRMVVDYSQTVNKYTFLDAYPLPNIESFVANIAKYKVFSAIDLKSAYHQIPIKQEDKPLTAFEANGKLYQFTRIPFGVTNGVACFQRAIDKIIEVENLQDTFAYLDDVTICGRNQEEHDRNVNRFLEVTQKYNLTLNKNKCKFSLKKIPVLGYVVENMSMRPDPERLKTLTDYPVPSDIASLRRALGMFSYYSKWIPKFSEKANSLINSKSFPLGAKAIEDFNIIKKEIANSSIFAVDEAIPFTVETDASEHTIAATLSQSGRPVAFFSKTLNRVEGNLPAVEKEAYAIVEALQKWRHFLIGRHFKLITDQRSVSYIFNHKHHGKIKNNKMLRWRLELAPYSYDIVYRPGRENVAADAFSRTSCSLSVRDVKALYRMHCDIGHPGITRMFHLVKCKNLPYSLEDVRRTTASCQVCAEIKPKFYRKPPNHLIRALAPFERLNIDFKGPIPSNTRNRYILTIVDEYSRFPFAIPCPDMSATTVVKSLTLIFSIFGMPAFVHSDQGACFMSSDLQNYLVSQGIATSRSSPYNPRGNGQVERYNGIIWKTISLILKSKNLKTEQWESVIPEALHSIRSLLCTSTNATPHERMFYHPRRSYYGTSKPKWLMNPGPVYVRKQNRQSKYEPLVEEAQLLEANPDYARVAYPDGKEALVSTRHIAAPPSQMIGDGEDDLDSQEGKIQGDGKEELKSLPTNDKEQIPEIREQESISTPGPSSEPERRESSLESQEAAPAPRRTSRIRKPPAYLSDFITK